MTYQLLPWQHIVAKPCNNTTICNNIHYKLLYSSSVYDINLPYCYIHARQFATQLKRKSTVKRYNTSPYNLQLQFNKNNVIMTQTQSSNNKTNSNGHSDSSSSSSMARDEMRIRRLQSYERNKLTAAIAKRIVHPQLPIHEQNNYDVHSANVSPVEQPHNNKPTLTSRIHKQWEIALSKILGIGYASEGNYVEIYSDGNIAFQQMFDAIDSAHTRILFETFIWRPDTIGLLMIDKLTAAAQRGCEVIVLYDGAGSLALKDDTHLAPLLAQSNATVTVFNSLFQLPWHKKSGHTLWLRTHRKILICDGIVGFAGGMNCTSQYAGEQIGGINTFRDTHMKIIGPAVEHLSMVFIASLSEATNRLQWQQKLNIWKQRASKTRNYLSHPYNQLYSLLQRGREAYTGTSKVQNIISNLLGNNTLASNIATNTVQRVQSAVSGSKRQFNQVRQNIMRQPSLRRARTISSNVRQRLQSFSRHARSRVRRRSDSKSDRHELLSNDIQRSNQQSIKSVDTTKSSFSPPQNITSESGTPLKIDLVAAEQAELQQQIDATAEHLPHHIKYAELARRRSQELTSEEVAELGLQRAGSRTRQYSASHDPQSNTSSEPPGDIQHNDSIQANNELPGDVFVQVLQSNVVRNTMHIQRVMHTTIDNAVNEILITNPFFIPPRKLADAISRAAKRGVKIKIITCGKSDTPYMRWAATHIYHKFLSLDIEIYEYNERILHAKTITIDGIYSSVGSFNMDFLSGWKLLELNISMISMNVSKQLQQQFYTDMKYTQKITLNTLNQRNWAQKLLHWVCYRLSRFVSAWIKTY